MSFWDLYNNAINKTANDLFFQKEISWYRLIENLNIHNEDQGKEYSLVTLKCLLDYNTFRTWPIDLPTISGSVDRQSLLVVLNKKYLADNNWLTPSGHFNFKPGADYFIIDDIEYRDAGDTNAAQTSDDNLLFYLILRRSEYKTGEEIYGRV
jgi:hypothetical protein